MGKLPKIWAEEAERLTAWLYHKRTRGGSWKLARHNRLDLKYGIVQMLLMFIRISEMWLFNSVPMSFDYSRIWGRIPFHNYGSLKWCYSFYRHWDEGLLKKNKKPLNWLLPATGAWQRFGEGGTWVVSATRVLTISDLERFSKHTNKTGDLRLLLLRENKNLHLLTSGRILPTEGAWAPPMLWTLETAPAEHSCPPCSSESQPLAPLVQSLSSPDRAGYLTDSGNSLEVDFLNLCVGFILSPGRIPKLTETRALRHFFFEEIVFSHILTNVISIWL